MPHLRYSSEEIVRRGEERYKTAIRSQVEDTHLGQVIVIDIESGEYAIDEEHLTAADRLLAKNPDAALYATRIGLPALAKIGGQWKMEQT